MVVPDGTTLEGTTYSPYLEYIGANNEKKYLKRKMANVYWIGSWDEMAANNYAAWKAIPDGNCIAVGSLPNDIDKYTAVFIYKLNAARALCFAQSKMDAGKLYTRFMGENDWASAGPWREIPCLDDNGKFVVKQLPTHTHVASDITDLRDKFYPVNTVYMSADSTFNPATQFGGTWSSMTSSISGVSMWKRTA